jgi:hypothetical protein
LSEDLGHPSSEKKTYENGITQQYREYRVIPSVLDPRKCEYLKDYSLDFE